MTLLSPSIRFPLVLGGAVLVATLAVLPGQVPTALKVALPPVVAALTGLAAWRGVQSERKALETRAIEAEATLFAQAKQASELRHDIRGYLSPALLNADRLSTNPDPAVRRAADTMIVTVERIEARLRGG